MPIAVVSVWVFVVFVDAGCNSWDHEAQHDVSDELRLRQVRVPDEEVVGEAGELTRAHLVEAHVERHGLLFFFGKIKCDLTVDIDGHVVCTWNALEIR